MKIGLISDTHNYFDPKIPELFQGVDHILHAGDVGLPSIIQHLEKIAPVTAVLGNTDYGLPLDLTEQVQLDSLLFLLHHIVSPSDLTPSLQRKIDKVKPNIVLFGHTHKAYHQVHHQIHFINPGYAGKERPNQPRTLALLETHPNSPFTLHTLNLDADL